MFTAKFTSIGNNILSQPAGVTLRVVRYDSEDPGGSKRAELAAQGPAAALWDLVALVGNRINLYNDFDTCVWVGLVEEVTVEYGALQIGRTTAGMATRVAVDYTTERVGGVMENKRTAWAEDLDSMAVYGIRELIISRGNLSDDRAEKRRDLYLSQLKTPQWVVRFGSGAAGGATIRCHGLFDTYDWTLYTQAAGLEAYTQGATTGQPLGLGFTSANVGFEDKNDALHQLFGRVKNFLAGYQIKISGSASNNGAFTVEAGTSQDAEVYTASTISFTSPDLVNDSANGLANIDANDLVQISGAANGGNNRYSFVDSGKTDGTQFNIDHNGVNLTAEAAGASVTIRRANSVRLTTALTRELPGSTVTVAAYGQKIAQSFTLTENTTWTVDSIAVRLRRVGAPGGDAKIELCANSSGSPGTVLDSATITGTDLPTQSAWVKFQFANTANLTFGTTYWIVVSRTDAADSDNYYIVDVSEDLGYADGSLKVYDGAAWQTRSPDADMPFRVLGAWTTTKQVEEITKGAGWQVAGVDMQVDSLVYSNQFRDGDNRAGGEIVDLLDDGTNDGKRILTMVGMDQVLRVIAEASPSPGNDWVFTTDGKLRLPGGNEVEEGVLPVGRWLTLDGAPEILDSLGALRSVPCRRAEYDVAARTLTIDPVDERWWDMGGIGE